jgi:hypothetical protein
MIFSLTHTKRAFKVGFRGCFPPEIPQKKASIQDCSLQFRREIGER